MERPLTAKPMNFKISLNNHQNHFPRLTTEEVKFFPIFWMRKQAIEHKLKEYKEPMGIQKTAHTQGAKQLTYKAVKLSETVNCLQEVGNNKISPEQQGESLQDLMDM